MDKYAPDSKHPSEGRRALGGTRGIPTPAPSSPPPSREGEQAHPSPALAISPTPWKAIVLAALPPAFRISDANDNVIAQLRGLGPTSAANTRLMAAGPKLYAQLEASQKLIERLIDDDGPEVSLAEVYDVCRPNHEALAEARGEPVADATKGGA